jgi:hypothetical protein
MCTGAEIALLAVAVIGAGSSAYAAAQTPDAPVVPEIDNSQIKPAEADDKPEVDLQSSESAADAEKRKGRKNRLRVGLDAGAQAQNSGVGTGLRVG